MKQGNAVGHSWTQQVKNGVAKTRNLPHGVGIKCRGSRRNPTLMPDYGVRTLVGIKRNVDLASQFPHEDPREYGASWSDDGQLFHNLIREELPTTRPGCHTRERHFYM
jgi:hypothetical protein